MTMLVSEKDKLIFIYSLKAGCTTAKCIFFDFLGILPEKYINNWGIHKDANLKKFITEELPTDYNKYLTIQFCRNPYDRAVSSFLTHMQHRILIEQPLNCPLDCAIEFLDFLHMIKTERIKLCQHCWQHARPQFITQSIQEIIKIENLDEELSRINKTYKLNFKNISYQKHSWKQAILNNKLSNEYNKPYEEYLSKEAIKLINTIYYADIKFFQYQHKEQ
jgi:hypothetical protein